MKNCIYLILLIYFFFQNNIYSQRRNDLQLLSLRGDVKSIKENMVLNDYVMAYNIVIVFNTSGFKIEKQKLSNTSDSIIERTEFIYDFNSNLKNEKIYSKNGLLIEEYEYSSNSFGMPIQRARRGKDNVIEYKETFEYDEKGNLIKEIKYVNVVPTSQILYKYDEKQRVIEKIFESLSNVKIRGINAYTYNESDDISSRTSNERNQIFNYKYEYDKYGNWIKQTCYISERAQWVSERKIEYFSGDITFYSKNDSLKFASFDKTKQALIENEKIIEKSNKKIDNKEEEINNLSKREKRVFNANIEFNTNFDGLKKSGIKCNSIDSFPAFVMTKSWIEYVKYFSYETKISKGIYFNFWGTPLKGIAGGVSSSFWGGYFYIMPNNEDIVLSIDGLQCFNIKSGKYLYTIPPVSNPSFNSTMIWEPFIKENDKWTYPEASGSYLNHPNFFTYNNDKYKCDHVAAGDKIRLYQAGVGLIWEQKPFVSSGKTNNINIDDVSEVFAGVVTKTPIKNIIAPKLTVDNISSVLLNQLSKKCLNYMNVSPKGNLLAATFCGCTALNTNEYTEEIYLFASQKGNPRLMSLEKPIMVIKEDRPRFIRFTCDNHYMLVKNSGSDVLSIWDLITQTKKTIEDIDLHYAALHPTNPNILAYPKGNKIIIFDFVKNQIVFEFKFIETIKTAYLPTIKFSADGKYLGYISCFGDKSKNEDFDKTAKFTLVDYTLISGDAFIEIAKKIQQTFSLDVDESIIVKALYADHTFYEYSKNINIKPKDEFETTDDFNNRIKSDITKLMNNLQNAYEKAYSGLVKNPPNSIKFNKNQIAVLIDSIGKYDADNKTYKIYLLGTSAEITIPPAEAKEFKELWWKKAIVVLEKSNSKSDVVYDYVNIIVVNPDNNKSYKVELDSPPFYKIQDKYKKTSKNIHEKTIDNNKTENKLKPQSIENNENSKLNTSDKSINSNTTKKDVDKTPEELLIGTWVLLPSNNPYYCYSSKLIFNESLTGREERIVQCDKTFQQGVSTFSWRIDGDKLNLIFSGVVRACGKNTNPPLPYVPKFKVYKDSLILTDKNETQKWVRFKSDHPKSKNSTFVEFTWEDNLVSTIKPEKWNGKEFSRKDNNANEGKVVLKVGEKFTCNPYGFSQNGNTEWTKTIKDWGVLMDCNGELLTSDWQNYKVYSIYLKFDDGEIKMYNIYEKSEMTLFGFYEQWLLK